MDQFAHDLLAQQSGATAAWIGGISLGIFIIVKIKKAFGAVWPFVKKFIAVVEDLFGAEARPGVAARPGLMARMQKSEENDVAITTVLEAHSETLLELKPNHGGSMKDVLNSALRAITEQGEHIATQGEDIIRLEQSLVTHINEQRAAVTNAEASAFDAATAVTNAEASAVDAATAATNAATAATGAAAAVVGAEAAVVGARAAVVGAEAAVTAATKDRQDRAEVHVNVNHP